MNGSNKTLIAVAFLLFSASVQAEDGLTLSWVRKCFHGLASLFEGDRPIERTQSREPVVASQSGVFTFPFHQERPNNSGIWDPEVFHRGDQMGNTLYYVHQIEQILPNELAPNIRQWFIQNSNNLILAYHGFLPNRLLVTFRYPLGNDKRNSKHAEFKITPDRIIIKSVDTKTGFNGDPAEPNFLADWLKDKISQRALPFEVREKIDSQNPNDFSFSIATYDFMRLMQALKLDTPN